MKKLFLTLMACLLFLQIFGDEFRGETNPQNTCWQTGTLLFKEDFGGNDASSPTVRPNALPATVCQYVYDPLLDNQSGARGVYVITKQSPAIHNTWYQFDDHTYPNDLTRGYLFACDAKGDNDKFYECTINNLCPGSKLIFSAWLASLCNVSHSSKARLKFIVKNMSGTVLAQFDTGDLPDANNKTWKCYGFTFNAESNESIKLEIINNSTGWDGNDFVMDDIEIRLCVPPVTLPNLDKSVCYGENVSIPATFSNDGSLAEPIQFQWLYSRTGDINTPSGWTNVNGQTTLTLSIPNATTTAHGYYRLAVAGNGAMTDDRCRVLSNSLCLTVKDSASLASINVPEICQDSTFFYIELNFTTTTDSVGYSVDFDQHTRNAGFTPFTGTIVQGESTIRVNLPVNLPAGSYTLLISFDAGANLCISEALEVPFTVGASIIEQNWNDVIAVLKPTGFTYTSFQWYKNGEKLDNTGSYIYVLDGLRETDFYHVEMTTSDGRTIVSCKLYPKPFSDYQEKPTVQGNNGVYRIISQTSGVVSIWNIYGTFIARQNIENQITLSSTGVYVLEILLDNGVKSVEKIIVP